MFSPLPKTLRRATAALGGAALAATGLSVIAAPAAHAANGVPRFDHVIVVMEENHSYNEIIGDTADAPYINNTLAAGGAVFSNSFAIEHPSEPNYLDLFSGANQGVTSDSCPETFSTGNEAQQLIAAGDTFAGYSEGLPSAGSTVCTSGEYARKHVPWTNFTNVPASDSLPFTSFPSSSSFASLPTVSWVIPNLLDDMHDGTIAEGDSWLSSNMSAYATWAKAHNSLLIVTWDEDDSSQANQIPTIFYGANVTPGQYSNQINHFSVLRTIEDMYGLPYLGSAASATSITNVWSTGANTVTVANPGNRTGTVGTAASLQISATDSASGQTLTYAATGLPPGLSINTSTGLISGTPSAAGSSTVTVSATDTTGATGSASFTWTVNPKPDFSLTVAPTSGSVTAGGSASATVATTAVGGLSGTVGCTVSGLPSAATATFNPASFAVGSTSTLTLGTASTTPAGNYALAITCTSGSLSHSATYTLTVNSVTSNTVTVANPGNQTGTVGTTASLQISATDSASGQTLSYAATGLPAGLSMNSSTGLISGTPSAAGSSTVTVSATDTTGATGSASFTWTVNPKPDFTLSVSPTSGSVTAGSTVSTTVSTAAVGGFTGTIADTASGNPSGVTATFNPASAAVGTGSTLTLATSSSTPAGTYSITITGTSGSLSHSATYSMTVNPSGGSGCTAAQLLGNPGFENGGSSAAPWTITSTHSPAEVLNSSSSEPPHSGTWDAWLDGWGTTTTDTVAQSVTIPSTCTSASFSFWLHIDTAETTKTTMYDTLKVQVLSSSGTVLGTLATFSNLNALTGYAQHTYSLAPYIGQSVTLKFTGAEDKVDQTSFVLDDTALNVD